MKNLFVVVAVFIVTVSTVSCVTKSEVQVPARISFVAGSVLHNGKEVLAGQVIRYGDIVQTRSRSACSIVVDEKNIIGMREDSTLVYKIKSGDALVDLKSGFLGFIVKNRKNLGHFRVATPTVTAAVRGTSFFIGTETPEKIYTCICNGVIHYHAKGRDRGERYAAAHHKSVYYTLRRGTVTDEPGEMKYHTDGDVEKLASEINVSIDWTKIDE